MAKTNTRTPVTKGKREKRKEAAQLASTAAVKRSAPDRLPAADNRPLKLSPGPGGRRLLAVVADIHEAWANAPDEERQPAAYARLQKRHVRLIEAGEDAMSRISKRRLLTLSDVADKLIAAAWATHNRDDYDEKVWVDLLSCVGLTLADVDEEGEPA